MEDLKLYASNDNELESLVNEVKIYSDNIGMEFGLSKCAILSVVKGKRKTGSGLELPRMGISILGCCRRIALCMQI